MTKKELESENRRLKRTARANQADAERYRRTRAIVDAQIREQFNKPPIQYTDEGLYPGNVLA